MKILMTIFATVLCAAGITHIVELVIYYWERQHVLPLNLLLFAIAILVFFAMALYAIWTLVPV